jgi:hypothetical protein
MISYGCDRQNNNQAEISSGEEEKQALKYISLI